MKGFLTGRVSPIERNNQNCIMRNIFSSAKEGDNFLKEVGRNVYESVNKFITDNKKKRAPNTIYVYLTCTPLQFEQNIMQVLEDSVDALDKISRQNIDLPTTEVTLRVILDPLPDRGIGKVRTECYRLMIPSIVHDTDATKTNTHYQDSGNYFDKKYHMVQEFDPDTYTMKIHWQFSGRVKTISNATFKVAITNPGILFSETHSSEYTLFGNDEVFCIKGSSKTDTVRNAVNTLHIDAVSSPIQLLAVRYNYSIGSWEYKVCRDNTIIQGEQCYPSDNYMPLNDAMTVTVDGIGLFLEPMGRPKTKR